MKTILKTVLAAGGLVLAGALQCQATILTQWTFENSPPADLDNSAASWGSGIFSASTGAGTASGLHASTSTDWSTPVGVNSANSMSANNWAVGDYFQFLSGTVGYNNIKISFKATGSATGPKNFKLAYSTTGTLSTDFTDSASYSLVVNDPPNTPWASSGMTAAQIAVYTYSFDLSGVSALNNTSTVYFRLINTSLATGGAINGANVSGGGTSRVDDFTIEATAVPEASTWYAGIGMSLAMLGTFVRKNRK